MSLTDQAIWWHVYPLGACGAPIHPASSDPEQAELHRLRRLEPWLDHAVGLGCSGLLLGPVFTATSHGYDTLDHYHLDPRLGVDEDLDDLIAAARRRGLSIMLDGVFNHVGIDHPLVVDESPAIQREQGHIRCWEGHGGLALLDHSRPEVADLVTAVMLHWLRRGIAGWRLDVAYAVPAPFWQEVIGRVRTEFPDAVFLGEVIHGDYADLLDRSGMDSITQYELWKAIWSSLKDRNLWELAWALDRHDTLSRGHILQTFVGNHDVDRIADTVGDDGAALAAALLMTLPGMPSVYYGDEHAFRGSKGTGLYADDPLRPPLPDGPHLLVTHGQWMHDHYRDLIGFRRRHQWLSRARVEVVGKDNTWISYVCTGEGHRVQVDLRLTPTAWVQASADDGESFTWSGQ